MTNNYHVIYSDDQYLLARMCTELMMEGCKWWHKNEINFRKTNNPFEDGMKWLTVYKDNDIAFYSHDCCTPDHRHTLTSDNYLAVLEAVVYGD